MMVSLSRSFNINSGGATFFSDSVNMRAEDVERLNLILGTCGRFRRLATIPLVIVHLLATIVLEIVVALYTVQITIIKTTDDNTSDDCREYFVIIYMQCGLWLVTLVVNQVVRIQHNSILRLNGYLGFYKRVHQYVYLPFYIVSLCSVTLMCIQGVMQQSYADRFTVICLGRNNGGLLSPISYLFMFITFETCLILIVNVQYILKVHRFNRQKLPPDVQREEWNIYDDSTAATTTSATDDNDVLLLINGGGGGDVGCEGIAAKAFDFLDKQADLIRHLKEQNARLGEKLIILSGGRNRQQQQRERQPDDAAQTDLTTAVVVSATAGDGDGDGGGNSSKI